MRVVIVSWRDLANPLAGGSEVVVDRLLTGMQELGHEVALVCGGPVGARPYEVVRAGGTFSQYLLAPLACRRRFRGWDVLIDVENGVPFFSPLWWRGPRFCLVHHVHTEQWSMRFGPVVAGIGRWTERVLMPAVYRDELFVAISESTAVSVTELGISTDRIRVVHSGIDVPGDGDDGGEWEIVESEGPTFLVVGRLVPHKRVEIILAAWESVRPVTGGRLVIAGDGPERVSLEERAGDRVEFTGRVEPSERDRLMAEAWFVLHAAHHEGWGMVIAEAAAFGTPTVALDAPGVRDVVVDGKTGILVRTVEELVDTWIDLAGDRSRRARLGFEARQRAVTFSWPSTTESVLSIASEAIELHDPARNAPDSHTRRSSSDLRRRRRARRGVARSVRLLAAFRTEGSDPHRFGTVMADDTVEMISAYCTLTGAMVVDVGGGSGYVADAMRSAGARAFTIEYDPVEMSVGDHVISGGVRGDGRMLPLHTGAVDVCYSSNVIEHVPGPQRMLDEMVRVVRPGGTVAVAFTNWLSPWGGHETSPWHYLGGRRAAEHYERRYGRPPKNRYGRTLFRLSIADVLRWARSCPDVEVVAAFPRYYPRWCTWVVRIPGVREVATWNLAVVLRKVEPEAEPTSLAPSAGDLAG